MNMSFGPVLSLHPILYVNTLEHAKMQTGLRHGTNLSITFFYYLEKKTTVGSKGQVIVTEEIGGRVGIKEYLAVIAKIIDDTIIIWKIKLESVSNVDFYSGTCSRKLDK